MDQQQLWDAGRVIIKGRRGRKSTCHCGNCRNCKRRDYMRELYHGVRRPRAQLTERRMGPNKDGYMLVYLLADDPFITMATKGERYALEHRLVMARHLSRPLALDEIVHHRNGDKTDNRLKNLELWTRSHPNGQRVDEKLEWAIEFVRRYAPHFFTGESK